MKDTDLAYAAGFFDGEGSVAVCGRNGTPTLQVKVGQVTVEVLEKMQTQFGGSIYTQQSGLLQWTLWGTEGANFLSAVLPWLVVKRDVAELGIFLGKSNPTKRYTSEEMMLRKAVAEKIIECNGKNSLKRDK